ncbi:hypothetical protein ACN38_g2551 [Penicillium nordicum]|uniref:Uncharacterized protein n=1 Tax=Penicillium nordicum TaxID=229535 RepID=A0A0M8PDQ5_9EURO|nr:hypothetical protein ACN38_g2551 [Penicillium nordicum]
MAWGPLCHVMHYIYRSLVYLSVMLRYSEWSFGLVCNSPVQGQVVTLHVNHETQPSLISLCHTAHNHSALLRRHS